MPINPNIALAARPVEIADPLAMYGKIAAIQGAQQQNALAQYQLGAAQRSEAATNALSQAYQAAYDPQTGSIDRNKLRQSLATGGFGAQIPTVEKALGELETQALARQKTENELFDQSMGQIRNLWGNVRTVEDAIAVHDMTHRDPIINKRLKALGVTEEMGRNQILQAAQNPQTFAEFVQKAQLGAAKFAELNKPQLSTKDIGGQVIDRTFAPLSGEIKTLGTTTKTLAPGEQQRINLEGQRVSLEQRRVALAEEEAKLKREGIAGISPKELQKREAAFPAATQAMQGFESKANSFIKDLEKLRDHPGLGEITGIAAGRLPGLTANGRAAQALYDKIVAKGGFQALQDLRDASKTGGALGNVSNQEGKQLTASFAAIDRRQDAPDVQAAIDEAIASIEGSKTRMREAYDATYEYRAGRQEPSAAAPKPPKLTPQDQEALKWANANPKDPRAAAIKQQLGVK